MHRAVPGLSGAIPRAKRECAPNNRVVTVGGARQARSAPFSIRTWQSGGGPTQIAVSGAILDARVRGYPSTITNHCGPPALQNAKSFENVSEATFGSFRPEGRGSASRECPLLGEAICWPDGQWDYQCRSSAVSIQAFEGARQPTRAFQKQTRGATPGGSHGVHHHSSRRSAGAF